MCGQPCRSVHIHTCSTHVHSGRKVHALICRDAFMCVYVHVGCACTHTPAHMHVFRWGVSSHTHTCSGMQRCMHTHIHTGVCMHTQMHRGTHRDMHSHAHPHMLR